MERVSCVRHLAAKTLIFVLASYPFGGSRGQRYGVDLAIVGIADRDYMRTSRPVRRRGPQAALGAAVALLIVAVVLVPNLSTRGKPFVMTVKPLGFGRGIDIGSPYPANDRWAGFLPPSTSCPGSTDSPGTSALVERAMICTLNYARIRQGLSALHVSPQLQRSSRLKALELIRCQEFSHEPCGRDARAVADAVGYPKVSWGENLYAGSGPFAPARVAAGGWLNSEHHRENLFRPQWTEQGIAVVVAKRFKGQRDVAVWVSEFGER